MSDQKREQEKKEAREFWKPVLGLEKTHEVSSSGRVRTWIKGSRYGRKKLDSPKILKLTKNKFGYINTNLCGIPKKVHRLVLEAFVGPAPKNKVCAHGNGNPSDNRLENLRWATYQENRADRRLHGREPSQKEEFNGNSKLSTEQVKDIKKDPRRIYLIARDYGVGWSTISDIKKGKKWKNVIVKS